MKTPPWLAILLAVLWSMLIFLPSLGTEPVIDDQTLIVANERVHDLGNWREWFSNDMWDLPLERAQRGKRLHYYRPVLLATYALDWKLSGGSLLYFHVVNFALHGLVTVLAILLFRRWTSSLAIAILAALFFSTHPARAENVAWVAGRPDLLCGLGVMICLHGVVQTVQKRRWGWPLQVLGALLAYLTKESAVVLPVFVLAALWFETGQVTTWREMKVQAPRWLRITAPYVILSLLYYLGRQRWMPLRPWEVSGFTHFEHAQMVLETIGRLLISLVYPSDLSMSSSTIGRSVEGLNHSPLPIAVGAAALLLLPWTLVYFWKRHPPAAIGLGLFFILLVPTSNLLFSGAIALTSPRFLYLPALGISLMLLGSKRVFFPSAVLVAGTLVVAGASARTWVRSEAFSSPDKFLDYEFEANPSAPANIVSVVARDEREGNIALALHRAMCGHHYAETEYKQTGDAGQFLLRALELQIEHLPDADEARLNEFAQFLTTLLGQKDVAVLGPPIQMRVPPESKAAEMLLWTRSRLLLLRAQVEARLGQSTKARSSLLASREGCERCDQIQLQSPGLALRIGSYDLAEKWWGERGLLDKSGSAPLTNRQRIERARNYAITAQKSPVTEAAQLLVRRDMELGLFGLAAKRLRALDSDPEFSADKGFYRTYGRVLAMAGYTTEAQKALEAGGLDAKQTEEVMNNAQAQVNTVDFTQFNFTFEPGGCKLKQQTK